MLTVLMMSAFVAADAGGETPPPPPCPYVTTVAGGPVQCGPFEFWSNLYPQGISDSGCWAGYRWQCGDNDNLTMAIKWSPEGGVQALPVPAGTVSTQATGINSRGTVIGVRVGTTNGQSHGYWACVWQGDQLIEIPPIGGNPPHSWAYAVNNNDWVVGSLNVGLGGIQSEPFVWRNGELVLIDPAQFGKTSGIARSVSDSGFVVGTLGNSAGSSGRAFRWKDGVAEILQPLPGAVNSVAASVSDAGVVVGNCRFSGGIGGSSFHQVATVWDLDGSPMALATPVGYNSSAAWGISGDGVVLGGAGQPLAQGAPLFPQMVWINGVPHALEDIGLSENQASEALAMNQRGQIVGYGAIPNARAGSAWIVTPTGSPADLNHNCVVDGADLMALLQAWGQTVDNPADFNHDGLVDGADLGMLLGAWTAQ